MYESQPSGMPRTVSLIGMPGVGKSTVGVLLAKALGLGFLDTDLEIQLREKASLQEILERSGYLELRAIEARILHSVELNERVIATGGSAVYSQGAMARLAAAGPIVYLRGDIDVLRQRVAAAPMRGIASDPQQTYTQIYTERTPLYERYADLIVDATVGSAEIVTQIVHKSIAVY